MNNLSKFKEERRILRGALTKCTQKLNEGEAVNDSVIHDKFNRIESLDSKIKDLLFDGKEDELVLEKELIDQEHYREMYLDTYRLYQCICFTAATLWQARSFNRIIY